MSRALRSRSCKRPVTFSDLPIDVLEKVVKKLDLLHCLRLRKVSRGLRRLVDSSEIYCEELEFHYERPYPKVVFDGSEVAYSSASLRRWKHKRIYGHVKIEEVQKSIADVSTFLKNPRCKIGELRVHGCQINEFLEFLQSLDFQLDVHSFLIGFYDKVVPILQCLKPGNLEEISLNSTFWDPSAFNEITETEQWKMAKKLNWMQFDYDDCRDRMEKVLHFKEIAFQDFLFDHEHLATVRDILLKSTNLEWCLITPYDYDPVYLRDEEYVVGILSQDPAYNSQTRRFSIPNTRDYFQLEFDNYDYNDFVSAVRIARVLEH